MKLVVCGDVHWSRYSSILRTNGIKFSTRLERLIDSVSFVERHAKQCNADGIVYLGDFFDRSDITADEITALRSIEWSTDIDRYMIVGNHEFGDGEGKINSINVLFNLPNTFIYDSPQKKYFGDTQVIFFPYQLEENIISLDSFVEKHSKTVVFSHNDICGIQMGNFISKKGIQIADIENNCDLFINGHLHNGQVISDTIINIGNLCGQNFSEDATIYNHHILILDTDTLKYEFVENPYAINFYKFDYENIPKIKNNSVCAIGCHANEIEEVKNFLENNQKILTYKIIVKSENENNITEYHFDKFQINHIDEFRNFILQKFGNSEFVQEELEEIIND